jgi:hypothetical protein
VATDSNISCPHEEGEDFPAVRSARESKRLEELTAMAKKKPLTWLPRASRPKKASIPETLQAQVDTKAKELVETVLKPKFIQPPLPKKPRFNYIIDVAAKWHGSSLYFVSTYACPGPTAISPTFEAKFARREFVGNSKFSLSFMRHTGKWVVLHERLALDECLDAILNDPWFQP